MNLMESTSLVKQSKEVVPQTFLQELYQLEYSVGIVVVTRHCF